MINWGNMLVDHIARNDNKVVRIVKRNGEIMPCFISINVTFIWSNFIKIVGKVIKRCRLLM